MARQDLKATVGPSQASGFSDRQAPGHPHLGHIFLSGQRGRFRLCVIPLLCAELTSTSKPPSIIPEEPEAELPLPGQSHKVTSR